MRLENKDTGELISVNQAKLAIQNFLDTPMEVTNSGNEKIQGYIVDLSTIKEFLFAIDLYNLKRREEELSITGIRVYHCMLTDKTFNLIIVPILSNDIDYHKVYPIEEFVNSELIIGNFQLSKNICDHSSRLYICGNDTIVSTRNFHDQRIGSKSRFISLQEAKKTISNFIRNVPRYSNPHNSKIHGYVFGLKKIKRIIDLVDGYNIDRQEKNDCITDFRIYPSMHDKTPWRKSQWLDLVFEPVLESGKDFHAVISSLSTSQEPFLHNSRNIYEQSFSEETVLETKAPSETISVDTILASMALSHSRPCPNLCSDEKSIAEC